MLLVGAIFTMAAYDIYLDDRSSPVDLHLIVEVILVVLCAGGAIYLARGWQRARRSIHDLGAELDANTAQVEAWRSRAESAGEAFRQAIDEQLRSWSLTPTEAKIARFLLEGYSHKEIAGATGRSERTARQHATAVYKKSGLAGRAELSAFFLQGLLLPAEGTVAQGGSAALRQRLTAR